MIYIEGGDVYGIEHSEAVFRGGFEISINLQTMHCQCQMTAGMSSAWLYGMDKPQK